MALTPRFVSNDMLTLVRAAIAELGIVSLPAYVCGEEVRAGALRRVLPGWLSEDSTLTALLPSRQGVLPSVRAFGKLSYDAKSPAIKPVPADIRAGWARCWCD